MNDKEINEAVAQKLGWIRGEGPDGVESWERVRNKMPGGLYETLDRLKTPPDYCHSIASAWEVANNLEYFNLQKTIYGWRCAMNNLEPIEADTAPMAICLAFLKLS